MRVGLREWCLKSSSLGWHWILPPLSNSWLMVVVKLYVALNIVIDDS